LFRFFKGDIDLKGLTGDPQADPVNFLGLELVFKMAAVAPKTGNPDRLRLKFEFRVLVLDPGLPMVNLVLAPTDTVTSSEGLTSDILRALNCLF